MRGLLQVLQYLEVIAETTAQLNTIEHAKLTPEDDPFADLDSEEDETVIDYEYKYSLYRR